MWQSWTRERSWKQSSEFALRGLRDSTPNSLWCSLLRLLNFLLKHPALLNLSLHVPLLLQLFPHADYTCDQPSALALGIKSQPNDATLQLHSHSPSYSKVKRVQYSKCKEDDDRWGQMSAWTIQRFGQVRMTNGLLKYKFDSTWEFH